MYRDMLSIVKFVDALSRANRKTYGVCHVQSLFPTTWERMQRETKSRDVVVGDYWANRTVEITPLICWSCGCFNESSRKCFLM
jgi:hypothetical protein